MTIYSAAIVSNANIAYKKGITLQQIRQLRDNLLAVTEGDATAPDISRNGLKTTTNSVSASLAGAARVRIALDAWSFFPNIQSTTGLLQMETATTGAGGADNPGFAIFNNSGGAITYTIAWRSLAA